MRYSREVTYAEWLTALKNGATGKQSGNTELTYMFLKNQVVFYKGGVREHLRVSREGWKDNKFYLKPIRIGDIYAST